MPKKVFAVTNVKLGPAEGQYFQAGQEIDHTQFNKAQLRELHEAGAIEIREVDDAAPDPVAEDDNASTENPDGNTEPDNSGEQNPEGSGENE